MALRAASATRREKSGRIGHPHSGYKRISHDKNRFTATKPRFRMLDNHDSLGN